MARYGRSGLSRLAGHIPFLGVAVIDATAFGANHIQVFHTQGMSAHSILLTRNDALELLKRLRAALNEKQETEALIPDD